MTALEYILNGLEAELALERELGVRAVELERRDKDDLKVEGQKVKSPKVEGQKVEGRAVDSPRPVSREVAARIQTGVKPPANFPFVFLHDKPLTPAGQEMIAKITAAMKQTPQTAPVVCDGPLPDAKVYIVLGALALKKWLPGRTGSPGMWTRTDSGTPALITYSPNHFLRFKMVTPAIQKLKQEMWSSLKGVMARI